MDNQENIDLKMCEQHKDKGCALKYAGVICAALLGSFLGVYVAADSTYNRLISPAYAVSDFEKINKTVFQDFEKINKDIDKMTQHEMIYSNKSAVEFIKTPESYKFIIDLTPFQGNADDIKVEIKGSVITISGESNYNKNRVEAFTKMSQTYTLSNKAKMDKLSKKKVGNKLEITVPIED